MSVSLAHLFKLSSRAGSLIAPPAPVRPAPAEPEVTPPATRPLEPPPITRLAGTRKNNGELASYPPTDRWEDWVEYEAQAWPRKETRRYTLVPTTCFNCESACGLLAYVDRATLQIRKFEGNPVHPGSRGRNCAKGPATLNQVYDPERILYPLKRVGARGSGQWERTTWDEVLDTLAGRIRRALQEDRRTEVMYHVGRPGEDGYMERVLQSWGIDGHNSHTNICSSGGRFGYASWMGMDRPSPDYANARFILLISDHLESGHYFNPHAQRIIEAKMGGAKIAVMDPRLSNTAAMADHWLPTWPGSEQAVLLAIARILLEEDLFNREFVRRWTNWDEFMRVERPTLVPTFDNFVQELRTLYATFTPEYAEKESGVPAETIVTIAREIGRAGTAFSTHNWRAAAAGNLGGWQVTRCLFFLNVLTGSVGTPGGTSANAWDKFVPRPFAEPTKQKVWNELTFPNEYPLAHYEMSILLPHFLREGRGKVDVYFTRVYNPVWTNPDGFAWIDMLRREDRIGVHAALTPVWNETAWFADYVLPMGHGAERHDTHSYETHAGQWIGFRQPVVRVAMERLGQAVEDSRQANPGEVWEEDEFWIELSWRIDPDGALGIRKLYESPYRPGRKVTIDEYYRWLFEHSIPGLPEAAAREGLTPLDYMRKYGVFEIARNVYTPFEQPLSAAQLEGAETDAVTGIVWKKPAPPSPQPQAVPTNVVPKPAQPARADGRAPIGIQVDGVACTGFPTPSGKLEFFSGTLHDWGWPEYAVPTPIKSHVHPDVIDRSRNEFVLLPNFRLPTLVHTRSGNAKWLNEISNTNPLWLHPGDAASLGVGTGDLVKVQTEIGYFVVRAWVTEGIRPGIIACSHHMGRWRLSETSGTDRWVSGLARLDDGAQNDQWRLRIEHGVRPFASADPDSERIWWTDAGVHQNLTFPVQPDPISGMHCWLQKVRLERAGPDDRYGDVYVDAAKSRAAYERWLGMTRPGPGPDGTRRPYWLLRPFRPDPGAYKAP